MVELRGFLGTNAGAAICGAAVAVFPTSTNAAQGTSTSCATATTTTNSSGEWSASCLAANTYDVRITCGSSVRWRHYCDEIQVSLLQLGDAGTVFFGAASDAGIRWSTGDADNHALVLAVGQSNQVLHVAEAADIALDWAVSANAADAEVRIHSSTTPATDYITIGRHTGTTADIDVVGGTTLNFQIAGTTQGHIDACGFCTISGNAYYINNTSVLNATTLGSAVVSTSITSTGALNSGSITSGFGTINTGSSTITTTGLISGGSLDIDCVEVNGKVVTMTGSACDTIVMTAATNGAFSLVTTDTAAAAANIQITADGTVDIDSAGVLTLDSGAAINIEPAAGSAILLDGTISVDAGVVTGATSITSTAFVGALTGNASGTAATVTGGTQSCITTVANVVTVGALNAGSITSGFGTINTGSSTITSTGAITGGSLVADNFTLDGTELDLSSGDFTLDIAGDIEINADGGCINFKDASLALAAIVNTSCVGELRIHEAANYIGLKPPALSANQTWTWPATKGSACEVLTCDGCGVLSWAAAGGARTVSGTTDNALISFVNSGSTFTAESTLTYNGSVLDISTGTNVSAGIVILSCDVDTTASLTLKTKTVGTDGGPFIAWQEGSGDGSDNNKYFNMGFRPGCSYFRFYSSSEGGASSGGNIFTVAQDSGNLNLVCNSLDNVSSIGIGAASAAYPIYVVECTATAINAWIHTNAGSGQNTVLSRHCSASPADFDIITSWQAQAKDSGTCVRAVAEWQVVFVDVTAGTTCASMAWKTSNNSSGNSNTTATLTAAGVWTDSSGEMYKYYEGSAIDLYDGRPCHVILDKIMTLDVGRYHSSDLETYNASLPESCWKPITERHISPTAEQFYDLFGTGRDPRAWIPRTDEFGNVTYDPPQPGLAPKDMAGVALWGIQELTGNTTIVLTSHEARLKALEAKLEANNG